MIRRNYEEAHFVRNWQAALLAPLSFAVEAVSAVHGTLSKIDSGAKTIVVVRGGTVRAYEIHFVAKPGVQGDEAGAKDAFHGLKEGSEVVAHYTWRRKSESSRRSRQGWQGWTEGHGRHRLRDEEAAAQRASMMKSADGNRWPSIWPITQPRRLKKAGPKSAKVTVYYTEDAGKKVVHFFEKH